MLANIEKGEYDLVIGIDSSGRIPALIIDKFINHIYSKKGYSLPGARFIAGKVGREAAKKRIQEWNPRKKVLIVEDTIVTGNSVKFLCQALVELKISFDIAAVGNWGVYSDTAELEEEIKEKLGVEKIYFGTTEPPSIYSKKDLSGVIKEGLGEHFSKPYKMVGGEEYSNASADIQENINQARADADIVVSNLIDWYESQHKNEK